MEPLDWVRLLLARLQARAKRIAVYDAYIRGDHPLAFASERFQEAFGGQFDAFADNWCPLVVESALERLAVLSFRWGDEVDDDEASARVWQANNLDARSQLAMKESLIHGVSYLSVWPRERGLPRIAAEHPSQVITAHADGDSEHIEAALKHWVDDAGSHATLQLPDAVHRYIRPRAYTGIVLPTGYGSGDWQLKEDPIPNELGEVGVIPLVNRPRLLDPAGEDQVRRGSPRDTFLGDGESEIAEVVALQDALNKTLMDALVASEFVGFPQRGLLNWTPDKDARGNYIQPFRMGADRLLWVKPNKAGDPEPAFEEFSAADLGGYVKLIEVVLQHIASITRTPPHYLGQLSGQFPSGETLKSAEAGLVAKVREKQLHFGEGFERAIRLALRLIGRGDRVDVETIWRDPESRTESEHVDALTKQRSLGIPEEILWEKLGYTRKEIKRIKRLRRDQDRHAAAMLYGADRDALDDDEPDEDPEQPGLGVAA